MRKEKPADIEKKEDHWMAVSHQTHQPWLPDTQDLYEIEAPG